MSIHNICFEQKYENIRVVFLNIFSFLGDIFYIFE